MDRLTRMVVKVMISIVIVAVSDLLIYVKVKKIGKKVYSLSVVEEDVGPDWIIRLLQWKVEIANDAILKCADGFYT